MRHIGPPDALMDRTEDPAVKARRAAWSCVLINRTNDCAGVCDI